MDPLRFFRGKDQGAGAERTVVRPTYSYMGDYFVTEKAIDDIVTCFGRLTPAISRVIYIVQSASSEAYRLKVQAIDLFNISLIGTNFSFIVSLYFNNRRIQQYVQMQKCS